MSRSEAEEDLRRTLRVALPVEAPDHVEARRGRLVDALASEIVAASRAEARRRRLVRFGWPLAAAALLPALGLAAARAGAPDAPRVAAPASAKPGAERPTPLRGVPRVLGAHDLVTTRLGAPESLALPAGVHLDLSGAAQLRVEEVSDTRQAVLLEAGHLLVDVPEQRRAPGVVAVRTPHALVEVTGTRFRVEVTQPTLDSPALTSVDVERGSVRVLTPQAETRLAAGDHWTSAPPRGGARAVTPAETSSAVRAGAGEQSERGRAPQLQSRAPSSAPSSTLAEENALLTAAVRAERAGRTAEALEHLGALLRDYPDSTLRAVALTEQRRLRALLEGR
jgi:hypothetical protein